LGTKAEKRPETTESPKLAEPKKALPEGEADAWKATPAEEEKAVKYEEKNGILPYVSEGRLDLPLTVKPKYSLKTADKYGIDPVLGIPLNKDGTVTVYYHTTKPLAVKLNASKTIPSEGRSRIYLTNESNGGKVVNKPGNFDQEFDGSTVLLNIDPSLLQMDEEYSDGRKDFFVPLAQGDFFNRKMNLASIQKSRKEGIVETFSDADMAQRMSDSIAEYEAMDAGDKKARLKQVRALLKKEHNIGTLLSENGKLEKTRVGDYGLKQEEKSVASMGLGLASAQQITDKLSSCPQSAICEGLCLGETSGGNFLYGGAASEDAKGIEKSAFRAGPRMMQYLKTEALVVHPEEFAILLNHEISMFEKWAAKETERKKNKATGVMQTTEKEIYQPAIRLNVTSDFRPKMWLPIFEAHPDTEFYDYTKLNGDTVAPNHHLTYSSTGVGQIIDGEKVSHKTNNWNSMRGRLDRGNNVAMAFSSKSALPETVYDEETGKTYQVWDGDNYDARFLDPKPDEAGNLFKQGMIIGLRNKASTLKEKTASKETDGFFVDYDPKRDGKQLTILDQAQFGFKSSAKKVIPIAKMSLREVSLSPDEQKFFDTVFDNKADLADFHEYVPSAQYLVSKDGMRSKLAFNEDELSGLDDYLGDMWAASKKQYGGQGASSLPKSFASAGNAFLKKARGPKLSLRKAPETEEFKRFFGNSVVVNDDGTPKVMYHGTARNIDTFKPRQAGAIFLTENPEFAGEYADVSAENKALERNLSDYSAQELDKAKVQAIADVRASYGNNKESAGLIKEIRSGNPQGEALDFLKLAADKLFPEAGQNIMPVYVRAERPFDYENPDHVAALGLNDIDTEDLANNVARLESDRVQDAIRAAGFDGFYIKQGKQKNLAVYNPVQIKSATGNVGTFDTTNPDIRYSLRNIQNEVNSLPNGAAINASIDRITPAREQEGFFERIINAFKPQSVDALRQQFLNRYNQLGVYDKLLAEKMGGAALLADASAESAALMSDNAAAIASMACGIDGKGGVPVFKNGFTTVSSANGEKGVLEILMPLAQTGDPRIYQTYQFWAGAKRGKRLMTSVDKDGNTVVRDYTFTPADIAYAKELCYVDENGNVSGKFPEFAQVQQDWIKYNNGLMKYAVDTGVLAPERAAEFMKYSDYIPFYRQIDGENTVGPRLFQNISGVTPPKKLTGIKEGQEAPLADFLETIVRNTQSIIQSGMKNTAAQRAIGAALELHTAERRADVSYAPGVVTVLERGKPVSYDVSDQLFIDAVKSLNLPELPFLSIFSAPANLLRNLITKDPGFMMANLMRDSLSAWVTSGAKMTPIASTISNFGKAIGGKDPAYIALRNAGVIGGYEFAQDIKTSGSVLGASLRRATGTEQGSEKALKPFTSLWRGLEKGTEASDAATRMAVYKSTLERTGNEAEAIYRAMEVLNFNRKGNLAIVRILTAAVPFLNARMQGLDVFYRAAFGKMASEDAAAIQRSFFLRGATLMALSAMYWFLTHDDEEYINQEQETRDNNWLFPSAGIRIPIPFEVGVLFKVVPERLLEYSFGNDTGKDLADSMKRNLVSTFGISPPQTFLPLIEARTNYSFFTMRPIVGQGMEGVATEFQTSPGTSELAKTVGKAIGQSPIMVDHIIKGYTGSMGMYAVDLIDAILFANDSSPKAAKRFEQLPVIKRFALDKEAKGTVTAYYELKNSVDEVVRTVNMMEATGAGEDLGAYMEKNAQLFGMRNYISSVEKQMKLMRQATIQIRSSDMSPEEKRDSLMAITQAQNAMTSGIRELKKSIAQ